MSKQPATTDHATASEDDLMDKAGDWALFTTVDKILTWARSNSLWPLTFGLACCAIEMMSTSSSRYDISRFGSEVFRASPRQADLLIVPGRLSWKMAPVLSQLYDQMPHPKWVISMGACASCGGVFRTYTIVHGIDHIIPVDVYVPGCPPRPEALLDGLVKLQRRIQKEGTMRRPASKQRNIPNDPKQLPEGEEEAQ